MHLFYLFSNLKAISLKSNVNELENCDSKNATQKVDRFCHSCGELGATHKSIFERKRNCDI